MRSVSGLFIGLFLSTIFFSPCGFSADQTQEIVEAVKQEIKKSDEIEDKVEVIGEKLDQTAATVLSGSPAGAKEIKAAGRDLAGQQTRLEATREQNEERITRLAKLKATAIKSHEAVILTYDECVRERGRTSCTAERDRKIQSQEALEDVVEMHEAATEMKEKLTQSSNLLDGLVDNIEESLVARGLPPDAYEKEDPQGDRTAESGSPGNPSTAGGPGEAKKNDASAVSGNGPGSGSGSGPGSGSQAGSGQPGQTGSSQNPLATLASQLASLAQQKPQQQATAAGALSPPPPVDPKAAACAVNPRGQGCSPDLPVAAQPVPVKNPDGTPTKADAAVRTPGARDTLQLPTAGGGPSRRGSDSPPTGSRGAGVSASTGGNFGAGENRGYYGPPSSSMTTIPAIAGTYNGGGGSTQNSGGYQSMNGTSDPRLRRLDLLRSKVASRLHQNMVRGNSRSPASLRSTQARARSAPPAEIAPAHQNIWRNMSGRFKEIRGSLLN